MSDSSPDPAADIPPGAPVDPFVCPRGHHAVRLCATRVQCRTCENQGRDRYRWPRSDLVDLRVEDPPLQADADGGERA